MASEIQDCLEAMLAVLELKSSSPPFNLFQLDETIVRQILSYLSFKQRMVLRLVCHSFNKAEQKIWHSTVSVNLQLEIERIFPRRQGYACRYIWYLPRLAKVLSLVCNLTLRRISFARPTRSLWHMTNFLDPQLMAIFFSGNWASVTELDLTGCAVAEETLPMLTQIFPNVEVLHMASWTFPVRISPKTSVQEQLRKSIRATFHRIRKVYVKKMK